LGDGVDGNDKLTPVNVVGINNAVAVSAGGYHTCALLGTGSIRCWGSDADSQLGDGDNNEDKATPVDVVGITNAIAISSGDFHTCALLAGGVLKCWGWDGAGQLGDGPNNQAKATPVDVVGITNAIAVSAGYVHTCAVLDTGTVMCWGDDTSGQVGDGPAINSTNPTPVEVVGITNATAVDAGPYHTCALLHGGSLKCWGADSLGQLGDGVDDSLPESAPVDVIGIMNADSISAGHAHTCASLNSGAAKCWGEGSQGRLGAGTGNGGSVLPVDVLGLRGASTISAGAAHTCSLLRTGTAMCWGVGQYGRLGNGGTGNQHIPLDVLVLRTCFALTLASSNGAAPGAFVAQSAGCELHHYLFRAQVALYALPSAGFRVQSWGIASGPPGSILGVLTMPAADTTLTVTYEPCQALTASFSGQGSAPQVAPNGSPGCPVGAFAAGEQIAVQAAPASGWVVAGWEGTQNNGSTSATNTVLMGAAPASVKVIYAPAIQKVHLPLAWR
jgi:alpha-tubulin suppressor-like RCC1 family protein